MNRPNELIKELEEFNETLYGYELCSSDCKELTDYISILEKALDKTCELLEISMSNLPIKYIPENIDVFTDRYELKDGTNIINNGLKNKNDWKEWSLKESERE